MLVGGEKHHCELEVAPDDGVGQVAALREHSAPRGDRQETWRPLRGDRAFDVVELRACKFLRVLRKGDIDTFVQAVTEYSST